MAPKKGNRKKVRTELRKNRSSRTRPGDFTRSFQETDGAHDDVLQTERISGKGDLTRKRTVVADEVTDSAGETSIQLVVDEQACLKGRVLSVKGLVSLVQLEVPDGTIYRCATRRLLKTLSTDQRHVVAAGDRVLFRPSDAEEGIIERIEPRSGVISRTSRGRQHVLVANVDQLLIIASLAEPELKPNLIDRMLVTAEKSGIRPLICFNKVDLVDLACWQPLIGVYGQMGYELLLVSAETGFGISRLRQRIVGRQSVVSGQSGVGKSSLLNAVQPGLGLRVSRVSQDNQKGRHTTTTAELLALDQGGYVIDTPGIRQFQLWDVIPEEVAGFFRDLRPYINGCRFPNCTHTHEEACAVKDAVADGHLDARRYESFCHLLQGDLA